MGYREWWPLCCPSPRAHDDRWHCNMHSNSHQRTTWWTADCCCPTLFRMVYPNAPYLRPLLPRILSVLRWNANTRRNTLNLCQTPCHLHMKLQQTTREGERGRKRDRERGREKYNEKQKKILQMLISAHNNTVRSLKIIYCTQRLQSIDHLLKPPLNCIVFANDSKFRDDDCITQMN